MLPASAPPLVVLFAQEELCCYRNNKTGAFNVENDEWKTHEKIIGKDPNEALELLVPIYTNVSKTDRGKVLQLFRDANDEAEVIVALKSVIEDVTTAI